MICQIDIIFNKSLVYFIGIISINTDKTFSGIISIFNSVFNDL